MTKASVDDLSALHGAIAKELTRRITNDEASAADIGAAIKFLKDNSITASIEDNSQMKSLKEKLDERASKRGLKLVRPEPAADLNDAEADEVIGQIARMA
jgi:hypothetical protein